MPLVGLLLALASAPAALPAQVRGQAPAYHQTYGYDVRVGIGFGHGGEADGSTWSLGVARRFFVGNCHKLVLSADGGAWSPPGEGQSRRATGGTSVSYLLNPCRHVNSAPNPTIRLQAGAGLTRLEDRDAWHVPVGLSIGWKVDVAVVHLEPWIMPRLHYRDSLGEVAEAKWHGAGAMGVIVGGLGVFGLQLSLDCCTGGIGGTYSLSLWF